MVTIYILIQNGYINSVVCEYVREREKEEEGTYLCLNQQHLLYEMQQLILEALQDLNNDPHFYHLLLLYIYIYVCITTKEHQENYRIPYIKIFTMHILMQTKKIEILNLFILCLVWRFFYF